MSKEDTLQADRTADAPANEQPAMRMMRRLELVPSKTNPRTHFDQAYLQELASSIREHRVIQPLLARPLPASRLQDTFEDRQPGEPLPTHEIVCGECRWRASGIADEESLPVLIRELTDVQVLQIQLVENLKRRDLHPLEEAEGFDRLLKDHGLAAEDIAAKVDKSVSYIYKTLKLLELTPECREQMYSGQLNRSVALLVARAPAALQEQVARDVMTPDWQGEPLSFRAAAKLVQERYMLQLSTAVFDIKDASLVPRAGDCASCPKRTGSNPDLFNDVDKPDTCTDPKCFDAKKVAHHARIAEAAKAKGKTVIQGKEAKEIIPHPGNSPKGYTLLDEKHYIDGRTQSVRSAIGKDNLPADTIIIVNPHTKQAQEALPTDVADKLLRKAAAAKKVKKADEEATKQPSEHELKEQYETTWRAKAVREIFAQVTTGKGEAFGVGVARELALYMCQNLYAEDAVLVAELLGLGEIGKRNAIETHIKECPAEQVAPALLLVAMSMDLEIGYRGEGPTPFISALAKDTGVDLKAVQADVKKDMKEAAAARKREAEEKATAKKPGAKKAPAKKTSAADAKAGIAQALQAQEGERPDEAAPGDQVDGQGLEPIAAIGSRVRVKEGLKGAHAKLAGAEGNLSSYMGDVWTVRFPQLSGRTARLKRDEFIVLPKADDEALATGAIELANGTTLNPQPAWPFPTAAPVTADAAAAAHAAAWPFPSTPKKARGKGAAA